MSAASRWSERAHRRRARDKRWLRRIAALPLLGVFAALLTVMPDVAAQTSRTVTMSIDGAGPPAGFTYPTMAEGIAGARMLRFTLDSPAPAGGVDTGTPGTAQNGNTQVIGTLIPEGDTSIAYRIHPSDDGVDRPNYAYVQVYPNTPPGGAFTVVPADRTVLLTVVDNDPTVVTLTRTDTGGGTLDEGGTARFEVSLSRPLVGAGDHGPAEVIAVPLRIDQTAAAVTTSDWSITLDEDSPNTGVSLGMPVVGSGEAFAHQVVTFSGAGAQTAVLEVAAVLDDLNQESDEAITISLASDAEFDGATHGSATNVGGGADPRTTGSPAQTDRFGLSIRNVGNVVAVPDDWALIPSGVQPGGRFRLLFITTSFHPATSGDIATYDAHVRARAAAGHTAIVPYAQKFRAVGSTASVSARNHAGLTGGGVPIYWLNGSQVAPNYAGFWSDRWQNWAQQDRRTQLGSPDGHSDWPWTGTAADGASHANHLGHATHARRGRFSVGPSTTGPISDNNAPVSQPHTLYGISPVFQVDTSAPFDVNYKRLYEGERKTIVVSGLTGTTVTVSVSPGPSDSDYKIYYPAGGSTTVNSGSFDAAVTNRTARFDIEAVADTVADEMNLELEFTQSGEPVGKAEIQILDGSPEGSILFRTCPNGGCSTSSTSGWVESDRPLIQMAEGGGTVTYQYKLVGHMDSDDAFGEASVTIRDTGKKGANNIGVGLADWDRIQCHSTEDHGTISPLGVSSSYVVTSTNYVSYTQWHDLYGGCWHHANQMPWAERDDWQTVTFSAGHDADAHDEAIVLEHKVSTTAPGSGYRYIGPPGQEGTFVNPKPPQNTVSEHGRITPRTFGSGYVDLRIVDDDNWDQEFLYSGDNGVTWTKASDGGLQKAIPDELEAGATHDVLIKLLNPSLATGSNHDYIFVKVGGCGDRYVDPPCDIGLSPNLYGNDTPSSLTDLDWGTGFYADAVATDPVRLRLHVSEDAAPGTRKALTFWNYAWLSRTDTDLPDPSLRQPGPNRNTASRSISRSLYEETRVVEVVPKGSKQEQALPPTLTIASAATSVTEGGDVTFTITADPAPQFDVTVNLAADEEMGSGEDLVASSLQTTIIIPAHQSTASWTHTAYSDDLDLDDGTVVGRIMPDYRTPRGYTVGAPSSVTLTLVDDDDPVVADDNSGDAQQEPPPTYTVDPQVIAAVENLASQTHHGTAHVNRWQRALAALGALDPAGVSGGALTLDEARQMADTYSSPVWDQVVAELEAKAAFEAAQQTQQTPPLVADDNSGDAQQEPPPTYTVDPQVIAAVENLASQTHHGTAHVNRWQRALAALGALDPAGVSGGALTLDEARQMANTYSSPVWDQVVAELEAKAAFEAAQQTQQTPPPTPEVNITSAAAGTEGSNVTFTLSATPAPAADLAVSVTVATSGDYGVTAGSRTVTIAGGTTSKTLTLPTTDDSTDEADGSVTLTLNGGSGYTVGQFSSETAQVQDDDDPQQQQQQPVVSVTGGSGVTEGGNASFTVTASPAPASALSVSVTVTANGDYGATTGSRTVAIPTGGSATFTVATTDDGNDEADGSVTATVNVGNGYTVSTSQGADTVSVADDDVPVVSISGGSGVTEGGDASFTITASPVPAADLTVSVTVTANGDYGATTGSRTVTVPTTGSATLTVATTDDGNDEADGSVTATVNVGNGYTVSTSQGADTVSVADDDVPVVSISGGSGVTEGGDASFTITASPVPAADLTVSVTVTASGDYGATTGSRTVTVPTTGSATLTVATTDDGNDEADGSVTATLVDGSDYDLGTVKTATVGVADDDDPPVETAITISIEDASASESASDLVFRVTLSEASNEDVTVQWATSHSQSANRARGGQGYTHDFWHARGEILIRAGETSGTGAVWLNQDSRDEPDEVFTVTLSSPTGATLEREEGTMTIIDDD